MGCQPSPSVPPAAEVDTQPRLHTDIPLRVWVVAQVSDVELLQRQWLANSEQPLQIRLLTQSELLQVSSCDCDVLLYPSGLIGELLERQWIVKLPPAVGSRLGESSDNGDWTRLGESSDYGQVPMGVSLGSSIPVFVASDALAADAQPLSWETVLEALRVKRTATAQFNFAAADVDRTALVDRFLTLVASVSQRDPGYGLLFDLQTMRSRLNEQEFLDAAELLAALAAQSEGLASVIGSHSTAWQWAATRASAALAIAPATLLDAASAQITTGQIVDVRDSDELAWNTGQGLVASVASRCRQSSQANAMLRWLDQPATRNIMADLIPGVEGVGGSGGNDTLVAKARQSLAQRKTAGRISLEPRLPAASEYRQALAEELESFLSGQKSAPQALAEADRRWNEISQHAGPQQRRRYEQSLNLSQ